MAEEPGRLDGSDDPSDDEFVSGDVGSDFFAARMGGLRLDLVETVADLGGWGYTPRAVCSIEG